MIIFALILLITLISLSGLFTAAELAVVTLGDSKIRHLAEQGHPKAKRLLRVLGTPGRFFATIQFGSLLTGYLASAITATLLSDRAVHWLLQQPWCPVHVTTLETIVVVTFTVVLTFFALVFGEIIPRRIGIRYAEPIAFASAPFLRTTASIARPFIWLLNATSSGILRLFGIGSDWNLRKVTEEEIRMMVDIGEEKGTIESIEKEMIKNVFEFNNKTVADIMVHRKNVTAIPITSTPEECRTILSETRFSRLPVYNGTIDDIVGILNIRDYLMKILGGETPTLAKILRPAIFVPETVRTDILFRDLQRRKQSLAVVLDEHGGTAGIVTLEDLLEEIVGEIHNEYSANEPVGEWEKVDDHSYRIRGGTALSDVASLMEVTLPDGDYHTLGGMIFSLLGVVPSVGMLVKLPESGLLLTVEKMDGRRVDRVLVRNVRPKAEEKTDEK